MQVPKMSMKNIRLSIKSAIEQSLNYADPRLLHSRGIMGMNQRNVAYVARYNDRRCYPNVDNKLKTKELALEDGIAVPALIDTVIYQHDVNFVFETLDKHPSFCIKPANGSGGKGILVIVDTDQDGYRKASGEHVSKDYVIRHLSNTLAGLFSLGGVTDFAIIEELIEFDPIFEGLSHEGVPDIRIIAFKGYPVMAMARLATHASDGKANLHQGAVGVGIDIKTGFACAAVQHNQPITHHPDTQRSLENLSIGGWPDLLKLASSCYEMSGLGYLGVDLVLDKNRGPLVLELNARPGLSIQIANKRGLLPRLQQIESLQHRRPRTVEERINYVLNEFND